MTFAARIGDPHVCPSFDGIKPHVGGVITGGASTVFIANVPAARQGDTVQCVGPSGTITKGSATVMIENMPAARMGDLAAHGGSIVMGCPTVLIGG